MQIVGHNNYFRHSDDIEANFVVSEKEYVGSVTLKEPHRPNGSINKTIAVMPDFSMDRILTRVVDVFDFPLDLLRNDRLYQEE
jgi:hypothetical protein